MRVLKLLVLALAVVSFAACGSKKKEDKKDPQTSEKPSGDTGGGDTGGGGGDGNSGGGDNGGDTGLKNTVSVETALNLEIDLDAKTIKVKEAVDVKEKYLNGKKEEAVCAIAVPDLEATYKIEPIAVEGAEPTEQSLSIMAGENVLMAFKRPIPAGGEGTIIGGWTMEKPSDVSKETSVLSIDENQKAKIQKTCVAVETKEKPEGEDQPAK